MFKARLIGAGVMAVGLGLAPCSARAQVGSALGNNPLMHQTKNQPGIDEISRRADKESGPRIIKDVKKAMLDADPKVRVAGLAKLRYLQQPEVTDILLSGLVDPDTRVKIKAIDIIGARQVTEAVPTMSQYLFLRSTEPVVKLHLIAALGRIGDQRGALPVMQYLKEAEDERSRGTAVFALGEIGNPAASEVLSQTATEDKSAMVRRLAQEAIEKLEGEMPSAHTQQTAQKDQQFMPTYDKLSKIREMDAELHPKR